MRIAILILAGGQSRRFGSDKRRARLDDGRVLLQASVDNAVASGLPVFVAHRPHEPEIVSLLRDRPVSLLEIAEAGEGMGATLAASVQQLRGWEGLLVALADMPRVAPASFVAVARALATSRIVRPRHTGMAGHPVGFRREVFDALCALRGDEGARGVISANAAECTWLDLEDEGLLLDIDTPGDIQALPPG